MVRIIEMQSVSGEVFVRNSEKHSCYVIMTYQVSKMEQQIGQISQCIIV